MKICLLSGTIGRGGASAVSYYVTKYLVSKGFQVDIITSKIHENTEDLGGPENVKIFKLPILIPPMKFFEFSFRAKEKLKKLGLDQYDIIHCNDGWGYSALSLSKKKDIKTVYTSQSVLSAMVDKSYHNEYIPLQNRIAKYTLYKGLYYSNKIGLQSTNIVTTLSKSTGEELKDYFNVEPKKIHIIPNGVDIEEFSFSKYKQNQMSGYQGNKIIILSAGRLVVQKGYPYLIKAVKKIVTRGHKNIQLIILGNGLLEKYLKHLCKELKLQDFIKFAGHIPREKIYSWYRYSDMFVCPSLYEPFGNVNVEAMASNLPIIASDVGGIPEIVVNKKTGLLVPPRNSTALADAIITLLEDEKLRKKMGKAGRKRVERYFNWKVIANKTLKCYKE